MPIVKFADVPAEPFKGGATYQTIVGDKAGSTPIRLGVQTSPPGYRTPLHSHPYMEAVTILEGDCEAWIDDGSDVVHRIGPGTTMVFPPNVKHWFRAAGDTPLVILGVHASPERIVDVHPE